MKHIQHDPVAKRNLLDTLNICFRDTFLVDGSQPNKSVASITSIKPAQYYDWRGPLIAFAMVGLNLDSTVYRDIDMNDFRHIVDYFLSCNHQHQFARPLSTVAKVKGVRINCRGDHEKLNKPQFEAVEVSSLDLSSRSITPPILRNSLIYLYLHDVFIPIHVGYMATMAKVWNRIRKLRSYICAAIQQPIRS